MDIKNFKDNLKVLEPERYAASLIGSIDEQEKLHYLYALNYEISKAAWISSEPLICQIRLKWWKDSLTDHSVIKSYQFINKIVNMFEISSIPIELISEMIDARYWDTNSSKFQSVTDEDDYINKTYGNLFWIGAQLLGADRNLEEPVRDYAYGAGVSSFLLAAPRLLSKNRQPFLENNDEYIKNMATKALLKYKLGKKVLNSQKYLYPILFSAWQTNTLLNKAIRSPKSISAGRLKLGELRRKWSFLWKVVIRSL